MEGIKCDYCGAIKKEVSFFIGASKEPAWTMVEGTGKMTCPVCFHRAVVEGQEAIWNHVKSFNKRG